MVQEKEHVRFGQAVGGLPRYIEELVRASMLCVALNLEKETRNEIDGAAHLRIFQEMQSHAVIVLHAVEPHPGHRVLARHVIGVIRLVLMPKKGERNVGHDISKQGPRRASTAAKSLASRTTAHIGPHCGPRTNLGACQSG